MSTLIQGSQELQLFKTSLSGSDIFFCTNPNINDMNLTLLLHMNWCTVGLCSDYDTLWYFDLGFPVQHTSELIQFFFFDYMFFSLMRGLGYSLTLHQQKLFSAFSAGSYNFLNAGCVN